MNLLLKNIGNGLESHSIKEALLTTTGIVLSVILLMSLSHWLNPETTPWFLMASLAASILIVFATPHAPMAQPWSLIMGQMLSAIAGLCAWQWVNTPWLAATLAVGASSLAMFLLRCRHAPGAATALFIALGGSTVESYGWLLPVSHLLPSLMLLVLVAVLFNYPFIWRRYPLFLIKPLKKQPTTLQENAQASATCDLNHEDLIYASERLKSYFELSEEEFMSIYRTAKAHHESKSLTGNDN
ncbi:MAG: hypothetical protein B7Z05_00225 [Thiotrichales bacterium 32-46-8]|nr:HPP family protein [Gammaproteobacteria bacterium]OYX07868.1 MAG: hypothetical protein B7Z05_00225 [Thiotrichales bacterium 32-46-8]OYY25125.1 MAG: hypothetical protein B7Y68_01285 [Thiotrichales bacterium 35-46-9]OYZ07818.1 MAG: hypothetical protein B7Y29_03250 [Thiotrichales bacterium 16-46-22]HQT02810.1 HPP family protein [Thiotrichales bacterium]